MKRVSFAVGVVAVVICILHTFDAIAEGGGPRAADRTPDAAVDPAPARAAELKRQGDDAIETLHYDEAVAAYTQAFDLGHDPAVLYNMARALEALGDYPSALARLESFRDTAGDALKARVPHLADRIANLSSHVATITVTSPVAGARVLLRSREIGTTPIAAMRVNAGHAVLEVLAEGYHPYQVDLDLPGGEKLDVQAELASKQTTGIVRIESPVVGADVRVDGRAAGHVPIEVALKAGSHALEVKKAGYDTVRTSVVVTAGDRRSLVVPLDKQAPITSKWWFWTGVGAVVVAGVVTSFALLTERPADHGSYPPGQVSGPLLGN